MTIFDVNNDAAISLTAKLEKLHRSAFPLAVRGTLNDVAAEARLQAINKAGNVFENRTRTFFRTHIVFEKSKNTFDLKQMSSKVGVTGAAKKSKAANGLSVQEKGGAVSSRKLIPLDTARISGSYGKKLQRKHEFQNIKIHNASSAFKAHKGSRASKFTAAVLSTAKRGSKYFLLKSGARGMVFFLKGDITSNINTRKIKYNFIPVLHYSKNRIKHLAASPFIEPAAKAVGFSKMNEFYRVNFEKRVAKLMK